MDKSNHVAGFIFAADNPFIAKKTLVYEKAQYSHRHR